EHLASPETPAGKDPMRRNHVWPARVWPAPICSVPRTVMLALAMILSSAAGVDGASLSISWTSPTTNADGTPLTDLSSYRIYAGSCPGALLTTVSSPTPTPAPGQAVTTRILGLVAGTTYVVRITAVDSSGNESACSGSVSGVAQLDFSVTPSTST